jgi:V8-like Glu-specific endopeptidase
MAGALSPTDPRAQADPSILNLPPVSVRADIPSPMVLPAGVANQAVTHSLLTGETLVSAARTEAALNVRRKNREALAPANPGPGVHAQTIFGTDDRTRVAATWLYPWRAQCKLIITFPKGTVVGSATMVSPKYAITAGHCVYDHNRGGWATRIEVIPGLTGTYKPYGSAWSTYIRTFTGWTLHRNFDWDLGLITLDREIGHTVGWFGYAYKPSILGVLANKSAYPGDRDFGLGQYYSNGTIAFASSEQVQTWMDLMPGESGSGFYRIDDDSQRRVFAVTSWQTNSINGACRISWDKFNTISSWIASGF